MGTPDTGGLTVNGQSYVVTGNSLTSTITLPANGAWVSLEATFDDESTCTALNGNAYFGRVCSLCPADVNGNGAIDVADVLTVLSDFGCESGCNTLTDLDRRWVHHRGRCAYCVERVRRRLLNVFHIQPLSTKGELLNGHAWVLALAIELKSGTHLIVRL